MMEAIRWQENRLCLLDQRKLPLEERIVVCNSVHQAAEAITNMTVRGAPAIGITAAYGVCLGAAALSQKSDIASEMAEVDQRLRHTRPTAVNLFWALDRMKRIWQGYTHADGLYQSLVREAMAIHQEDVDNNRRLGMNGQQFLQDGDTVMTYCNAGALATGGYGTALGIIRAAVEQGKRIRVAACETRPFLQGARLTCYELSRDHIDVTLLCDNMAGVWMRSKRISSVIVGADRVAKNGDVVNKVGTYSLALLASAHSIPFYVAAPCATWDTALSNGDRIPIEQRDAMEVTQIAGQIIAPEGVHADNPAFDCTPYRLITAIVTERGCISPGDQQRLFNKQRQWGLQ